jgi:hypothetical protein
MAISFNLRGMFLLCVLLMIWHMVLPYSFLVGILGIAGYLFWAHSKRKVTVVDLLFAISFLFNLWYILGENISFRQYDYFNFFMHAVFFVENDFFIDGLIGYLRSVFFQPPLWGLIAGVVTKIALLLGETREFGFDLVRFMSLFSISGVMILAWRWFSLFDLKRNILVWGYAVFLLFPIHMIMAGFNNNDALVYFFMMALVYEGYLWYVNQSLKRAFIIAGILVLAGMTKFSGLMVVAYLGMLGIALLIKHKTIFDKSLFIEFGVIGMGAILGFAWGIFLLYNNFPLVPPPQNVSIQLMEKYSIWERLFDFSSIGELFVDIRQGIVEPNVWLSLIKTATFGEWNWGGGFGAYSLYVLMILLAVMFVFSFNGIFKYKIGEDFGLNLAIVVYVFAIFISWALFWIEYPYFCSTEFRYVVAVVPMAFLWLMNYLSQKKLPTWMNVLLASFVVVFAIARFIVCLSTI